jgi:hypothetical protein
MYPVKVVALPFERISDGAVPKLVGGEFGRQATSPPTIRNEDNMQKMLLALVVVSLLISNAAAGQIPDRIDADREGVQASVWLTVEAAISQDGLRRNLFSLESLERMDEKLASARSARQKAMLEGKADKATACALWSARRPGGGNEPMGLSQLVDRSDLVIRGYVSDMRLGFFNSSPGILYEVVIEDDYKIPLEVDRRKPLLLFYGEAQILVGDEYLCATERRFFQRPEMGKGILLLSRLQHRGRGDIWSPDSQDLFFEIGDGLTGLPLQYGRVSAPPHFADLGVAIETHFDR